MDYSRRHFLQTASGFLATTAFPWPVGNRSNKVPWPILQGATDATSTTLIICHPNHIPLAAEIHDPKGNNLFWRITDQLNVAGTASSVTQVTVESLSPSTDYTLKIYDPNGNVIDQRIFQALDMGRKSCRFAVVSCMNDRFKKKSISMWRALYLEKPDFVIFLGDTVYADNHNSDRDAAGYGRRYYETRSRLGWFFIPRLIPSYATWDDHDFGINNGDRHFPMAQSNQHLFRNFWGTRFLPSSYKSGFGVGSILSAFGQRFFLMDDRSFRDEIGLSGGSHWGNEQKDWLLNELAMNSSPAWILNGSQFFGGYLEKESFESNHAEDFKDFLTSLKQVAAPVCFVSGDVHFSEVMRIEPELLGYETFEFTSSSIHSRTFPGYHNRAFNPRRVVSEWRHNFLIFESHVGQDWQIGSRCVLNENRTSFEEARVVRR